MSGRDQESDEDEAFATAAGTDQVDGEELYDLQGDGMGAVVSTPICVCSALTG